MFAEQLGPELVKTRDVLNMSLDDLPPSAKVTLAKAKLEAGTRVKSLTDILGLDDDG